MSDRDYLERTILTVRNHRGADNCWPQWANIFADEIERLWKVEDAAERRARTAADALENLDEDAAAIEPEDLTLHELERRLGAMLLGFGGGHNHLEDIREALAVLGET